VEGSTYTSASCVSGGGKGCFFLASAGVDGEAATPTTFSRLVIDTTSTGGIDPAGPGRKLQSTVDSSFSGALAIATPEKTITRTFGDANPNTYADALQGTKGASVSLSLSHSIAGQNPRTNNAFGRSWSKSTTIGSKDTDAGTLTSAGSDAEAGDVRVSTYGATGLIGEGQSKSSSYLSGSTKNRKMLMV
jgi:hypothetical protein